ncbi:MAG: MmcQ/YjbR family DNA-binding protein [Gemmatimonadales bacterium]
MPKRSPKTGSKPVVRAKAGPASAAPRTRPDPVVADRLRKMAMALPGTVEKLAHGEPTFRTADRMFAMYASPDSHHGNGRTAVWVKSTLENQEFMIRARPDRFFVPPYVGPSGWVGMWLDRRVSWKEVAQVLADGHLLAEQAGRRRKPAPGSRRRPR